MLRFDRVIVIYRLRRFYGPPYRPELCNVEVYRRDSNYSLSPALLTYLLTYSWFRSCPLRRAEAHFRPILTSEHGKAYAWRSILSAFGHYFSAMIFIASIALFLQRSVRLPCRFSPTFVQAKLVGSCGSLAAFYCDSYAVVVRQHDACGAAS